MGVFWRYNGWMNHPLIVQLGKTGQPWRQVASGDFHITLYIILTGVLLHLLIWSFVMSISFCQS